MGFGFRGSSLLWPYVGLVRGGLPRCGYFLSGAAGAPVAWSYQEFPYLVTSGVVPFASRMTREQELDFLKNQANTVKSQLEQIEARIRELEVKEK